MRRAAKRDANESEIVTALRAIGASVTMWGIDGAPDLVVFYLGRVYLLEVKVPSRTDGKAHAGRGGRGELTAAQVAWWDDNPGAATIVHSIAEALAAVGSFVSAEDAMRLVGAL